MRGLTQDQLEGACTDGSTRLPPRLKGGDADACRLRGRFAFSMPGLPPVDMRLGAPAPPAPPRPPAPRP